MNPATATNARPEVRENIPLVEKPKPPVQLKLIDSRNKEQQRLPLPPEAQAEVDEATKEAAKQAIETRHSVVEANIVEQESKSRLNPLKKQLSHEGIEKKRKKSIKKATKILELNNSGAGRLAKSVLGLGGSSSKETADWFRETYVTEDENGRRKLKGIPQIVRDAFAENGVWGAVKSVLGYAVCEAFGLKEGLLTLDWAGETVENVEDKVETVTEYAEEAKDKHEQAKEGIQELRENPEIMAKASGLVAAAKKHVDGTRTGFVKYTQAIKSIFRSFPQEAAKLARNKKIPGISRINVSGLAARSTLAVTIGALVESVRDGDFSNFRMDSLVRDDLMDPGLGQQMQEAVIPFYGLIKSQQRLTMAQTEEQATAAKIERGINAVGDLILVAGVGIGISTGGVGFIVSGVGLGVRGLAKFAAKGAAKIATKFSRKVGSRQGRKELRKNVVKSGGRELGIQTGLVGIEAGLTEMFPSGIVGTVAEHAKDKALGQLSSDQRGLVDAMGN